MWKRVPHKWSESRVRRRTKKTRFRMEMGSQMVGKWAWALFFHSTHLINSQFSPHHLRLRWLILFSPLFHFDFMACFISLRFLNCDYSTFHTRFFSPEYWDPNDAFMHRFRINHISVESLLNSICHKRYVQRSWQKFSAVFFYPFYLRVGDVPSQFISKMSIPANIRG